MRMLRNIYLPLLLLVMTSVVLQAQQTVDTTTSPVAYPDTTDGLRGFLRDMRTYVAQGEHDKLAAALKQTEIPNAPDWFHKTYPETAELWIGPYQNGLEQNERAMQELLSFMAKLDVDFVAHKLNDSARPGKGIEWGMIESMRQPVEIYSASWKYMKSNPKGFDFPIGYFVYIDGGFRWDTLVSFGAYRVGGAVSAPKAIYSPDPQYPKEAGDSKIEATVPLGVIVDADGLPEFIKVLQPAGHGFDEKAIEAVQKWRFKPAMKDGQRVHAQILLQVNFRPR